MISATLRRWFLPYFSKFSWTCAASSRVGSRIRVRGMRARARPLSSSVSIGSTKRRRLAGAGLGNADNVLLLQDMRDGLGLDFGGLGVTGGGDRLDYLCAQAESGKVICQISGPLKWKGKVDGQLLEEVRVDTLVAAVGLIRGPRLAPADPEFRPFRGRARRAGT